MVAPEISVIIRAHNSEGFVRRAIESALNQTLDKNRYEIIVVDDGSTDSTKDTVRNYGDNLRLVELEKTGAVKAANIGVRESNGYFVTLLDSDDELEPEALQRMLAAAKEEKADFVYCDYYERDTRTRESRIVSLKANIFNSVACGILFRKGALENAGGHDEALIFPEYDLLIKLLNSGAKHAHVPVPLFTYNRHPRSITADKGTVKTGMEQLFKRYGKIEGLRGY